MRTDPLAKGRAVKLSWVKIDDGFSDHPKVASVGLAGKGLYVSGLCYCNRQLTDGEIPMTSLVMVSGLALRQAQLLADRLVEANLWDRTALGYRIHDYLKYQDSRDKILEKRAKDLARKTGGFRSESDLDSTRIPTLPLPLPLPSGSAIADPPKEKARARPKPLSDEDLAELRPLHPTIDIDRELLRCRNWQANNKPYKNEKAGFKNWLMKAEDNAKTEGRNGIQAPSRANGRGARGAVDPDDPTGIAAWERYQANP